MNPLQSPPYVFFQSNPTLFDDAEMLQTDVMRFFAILSLCLMAIFALVKTLPMAPPDTRPAMAEPANQEAEAKRLQNNLGQILKDIADKRRVRTELSIQIENENQNLTKIREKMAQIRQKMDQNYQPLPSPLHKLHLRHLDYYHDR